MTASPVTLSRYATHDASAYPGLWRGCVGAWCPGLGPSGTRLHDYSRRMAWGTLTNTTLADAWAVNGGEYALNLDGSDDYVGGFGTDLAYASGADRNISMSCWFRSTATVFVLFARALLGSAATRYTLAHDGVGGLYIALLSTTGLDATFYATGTTTNDGKWHHAAATIASSGFAQIYVDGVLRNSGSGTLGAAQNYAFIIGKFNDASGGETGNVGNLAGQMDDIRMYSRILNSEEIRLLSRYRGIAYTPRQPVLYSPETDAGGGGGVAGPVLFHSHYMSQGMRP